MDNIKTFLEDLGNSPKYLNSKAILNAIIMQQGILTERAEDICSFSHLTEEYLTAQYLSQNPAALVDTISQYATAEHWREVFLLVSGFLPKADDVLRQIEQIAQQRVSSAKLQELLAWSNWVTVNSAPAPAKRAGIILCALDLDRALDLAHTRARLHVPGARALARALDRALDLVRALDRTLAHTLDRALDLDLDRTLAHTLDRALGLDHAHAHALDLALNLKLAEVLDHSVDFSVLIQNLEVLQADVPDNQLPCQVRRAFADRLQYVWYEGFGLDTEQVEFSEAELEALADYFYLCELMVRCKESAVWVSKEVWESIEAAMVMPSSETKKLKTTMLLSQVQNHATRCFQLLKTVWSMGF